MKRKYMAIDMNAFHVRIEDGFDEPSVVAIDNNLKYVAAGKQAIDLLDESEDDSIKLVGPVACSTIRDHDAAVYMLKTMLRQQGIMKHWWSKRYDVICQYEICATLEAMERRVVFWRARFGNVKMVDKGTAIAQCCELGSVYFGNKFMFDSDKAIGVLFLGIYDISFFIIKEQEIKNEKMLEYDHLYDPSKLPDYDCQGYELRIDGIEQFVKRLVKERENYEEDLRVNGIILSGDRSSEIQEIQEFGTALGFPVYRSKNPSLDTINGLKLIRDRLEKGDRTVNKCFYEI